MTYSPRLEVLLSFRSASRTSEEAVRRGYDPVSAIAEETMRRMERRLDLPIDPRDIRVSGPILDVDSREYETSAWWKPETHEVELLGGPNDGAVLTVADIDAPITLAMSPIDDPTTSSKATSAPSVVEPRYVLYSLHDWNPTKRKWVFTC